MTRVRVAFVCLLGGTCSSLCVCVCVCVHSSIHCRLDDTVGTVPDKISE